MQKYHFSWQFRYLWSCFIGLSFADDIYERNNCTKVKEDVSGTTLIDNGLSSYISRMKTIDHDIHADLSICQLPANDATENLPLDILGDSSDRNGFCYFFDAGAMETMISYASDTWHCPVVFYTNPVYDSTSYQDMVTLILQIQKKWEVGVIRQHLSN